MTNWTSSLTLDRGTIHGVESGDCVIDETYALARYFILFIRNYSYDYIHSWC